MKHNLPITLIILGMFLITQLLGLFLISKGEVPSFLKEEGNKSLVGFINIIIAFVISLSFFFLLIQYKWKFFIKLLFGVVIFLAISISLFSLFSIFFKDDIKILFYSFLFSFFITLLKILRPSVIIHNITEIFIYSGVSMVFVSYLTPLTSIIFLVLISFYDMWAVWHTKIMQKMAKFQINEIKIFNGFFIPYLTKEMRKKIKKRSKKIKIPVAILGGGDIAFTLIPAGVFLIAYGLLAGIFVVLGGFLGLCYLLIFSEKKKAYPAMPFITIGIFIMLFFYFFFLKLFL